MPLFVYSDLALATQVAKTAFLVASVLIADAMIVRISQRSGILCLLLTIKKLQIYRLYVVWSFNKYIIILPMLTWCGLVGEIMGTIDSYETARLTVFVSLSVRCWRRMAVRRLYPG